MIINFNVFSTSVEHQMAAFFLLFDSIGLALYSFFFLISPSTIFKIIYQITNIFQFHRLWFLIFQILSLFF